MKGSLLGTRLTVPHRMLALCLSRPCTIPVFLIKLSYSQNCMKDNRKVLAYSSLIFQNLPHPVPTDTHHMDVMWTLSVAAVEQKKNPVSLQWGDSLEICVPSQKLWDCRGEAQGATCSLKATRKRKLKTAKGSRRTHNVSCNLYECGILPSTSNRDFRGTKLKHCPLKILHIPDPSFRAL